MTKNERAKAAIETLIAAGWTPDGETQVERVRIPTARVPLYGKSGGEPAEFGGRARFRLEGTDRRATVGPRTTCFYRVRPAQHQGLRLSRPNEAFEFRTFDTSRDIEKIGREARRHYAEEDERRRAERPPEHTDRGSATGDRATPAGSDEARTPS